MCNRSRAVFIMLLAVVVSSCAARLEGPSAHEDAIAVKGELTSRERFVLPLDSEARLKVVDTAHAGHKALVVARQTIVLGEHQVSVPFDFDVKRDALVPEGRYMLRARINGPGDRLLWASNTRHPVDTDLDINDFGRLILEHMVSNAAAASDRSEARLIGPEWVVEDIASAGIIDASRVTVNFNAGGRLYGHASCNRYSGHYDSQGHQLLVGQLAVTTKTCASALEYQERRFLELLQRARRFKIDATGKLVVRTDAGHTLKAYPER